MMPKNNLEEKIEGIEEMKNPEWIWRKARWGNAKCEICAYPIKSGEMYFGKVQNTDKRRHAKCHQSLRQFASDITEEILVEIENRKEYHKRMGTTDSFHNGGVSACVAILEAIKSKRAKLLGKE